MFSSSSDVIDFDKQLQNMSKLYSLSRPYHAYKDPICKTGDLTLNLQKTMQPDSFRMSQNYV